MGERIQRSWRSVAAASLLVALTGCGGDDAPASGADETGAETEPGTSSTPTEPGTSTGLGETGSQSESGADGSSSGTTGTDDACATDVTPGETVVLTDRGPVEGAVTRAGPVAFLGIPYAAPPTGALRWAAPEPAACWTESRDATALGPMCPQLAGEDGPVVGDEDCLQLNVWTPAADDEARPVLVFIHGGGNALGTATDPLYDGSSLSDAGDQVVVTINYRIGALGWLTHPELPDANLGLRDQVAALQWVAANAAAFGGDPDRVTVFGESGGAVNTCTLLGSPLAAGLFRAAIVQSGACNHRPQDQYAEQMSTPWLANTGCADEADPIACLRALPPETLVAAEPTGYPDVAGVGGQGWGPTIDPQTLPVQTLDAMRDGTHNDVPVIIGANADETFRFVPGDLSEAAYEALVLGSFGPLSTSVLEQYPLEDYASPRDAYVAVTSDLKFVCTARRSLRAAATGRSPVYRYHFTHEDYWVPGGGETGAFHGLELIYVFGNFDAILGGGRTYPTTAADEEVRTRMQALWSSFAADAEPSSDPSWPVYDADTDPYLQIESTLSTGQGLRTEQCDFWDALSPN